MTGKQFTVTNISTNGMKGLFKLGNDTLSVYDVARLVNELLEENEQLKQLCEILKEKIQFYEDQVVNPECPVCHTILRKISIDFEKDRYYRKCSKCGYEREESLI